MFNRPAVFIDIETTGVNYKNGRIIEIAAIRLEDDKIVDEYHSLVNPGTYLPAWISSITGITDADLIDAPYFDDIAHDISRICEGALFIAHNARFDYSFIRNQMAGCGFSFKPQLLCTVRLSRALYPEARGHKLENIIKRHKIKVSDRHRAYDDARALKEFCGIALKQKGAEIFNSAVLGQLKTKTLPPNLNRESINNLSGKPGVYIFEDNEGKPVYIGKSVNLKKRVLSHFAQDISFEKEMKLSLSTHNIKTIETENELQALLLESKLIKQELPLYNRQLRRVKKYTALLTRKNQDGYTAISVNDIDLAECADTSSLYGVYSSKGKAKAALADHQKTFSLCPKLLGLEKGKGACFQYQLGRCHGACVGKETADKYNLRVELALEKTKIAAWPYDGPVIVKHKGDASPALVIDQWRISAEYHEDGSLKNIEGDAAGFSLDNYKILKNYLRVKGSELIIKPFDLGRAYN